MTSVSVIIPTYNCARFIGEAVDSIVSQTRAADEIIVVDDGSGDDTESVVFAFNDPRIKYVWQQNSGASCARNHGLSIASGDYIAFLDADDRWRPGMLEKQTAVLDHDARLACVFANFRRFEHSTGRLLGEQFKNYAGLEAVPVEPGPIDDSYVISNDAFSSLISLHDIPAFTQVMLFRRSLISDLRFDEALRICEDLAFALRVFMQGPVAFNSEVLAEVRRHDTNLTRDLSLIALDKLVALKSISAYVVGAARRINYTDRVIKAHMDAANASCRQGHIAKGAAIFLESLELRGSHRRKAKGAARMIIESVSTLLRRTSNLSQGIDN